VIKKRLVAVVTVKQGRVVQSFGYERHLPVGSPEVVIENFDRWGADEILLQCIDRDGAGPDLDLLQRVSRMGLSTPLIYAGGIRNVAQGVAAIQLGADRICVDALLHDDAPLALELAKPLGAQAIIAALPLSSGPDGLLWRDYRSGADKPLAEALLPVLQSGMISEAMVIDWRHEGTPRGFDMALVTQFPADTIPIIAFGGISAADQLRSLLRIPSISAMAIGNFLNYREHAIQDYKKQVADLPLRPPCYESGGLGLSL
jgi:cyclase